MPGKGKAPTPTQILRMRGNPHVAKQRKGEPEPPSELPEPPKDLGRYGAPGWRRICKLLEPLAYVAKIDRAMLANYCRAWNECQAWNVNRDVPAEVRSKNLGQWMDRCTKYAAELGFTPALRTRIRVPEKKTNNDGDQRGRWVRNWS